jgi:hypothetical protein
MLQNIGDINDFHVYVPNIDGDIGEGVIARFLPDFCLSADI